MTSESLPANLIDHVPPAARADEAEATLLGCCLNWPTPCLAEAEKVVGLDDFFDPRYQRLFAFLLGLGEDTRDGFDLASLARALEQDGALEAIGGRDELIRLSDMAATQSAARLHAKAIREAAVTRQIRDFACNLIRDTGRADFKPADVLPAFEERLARLAQGNGHAGAVTVCLADVEPEAVRWLWPERIALGKPTILVGDPGLGKSFITLDLAARVTTGAVWPDDAPAGGVPVLRPSPSVSWKSSFHRPRKDHRQKSLRYVSDSKTNKPQTLAAWAATGRYGLPVVKVGGSVRYRLADLEQWVATRTVGDASFDSEGRRPAE